jgi:hypothetical protein
MSAYDNPTIIRDDSAMVFSQSIASFGENFTKAMNAQLAIAAEEKKYEAKLKKETDANQLAIQQTGIKQALANQKEVGAAVDKIPAVDTTLTNQFKAQYSELQEKVGNNNTKAAFSILTPEELSANNKFAEDVTAYKDKTVSTLAAMATNTNEWASLGPRDRLNKAFFGATKLDRKISEITCYSSNPANYDYKDKVVKNLYKEDDNPANPGLEIITKVDPAKDLAGFTKEELDAEAKKKDGSIIYDEATGQYSIRFKQKLGTTTWDGNFYHTIPEAPDSDKIWGKTQANIVNEKGELNNSFIINPGNPVITKEKIKDFPNKEKLVETTYLNMPSISKNAQMYYDAGARALLNSDLKDMGQLQAFLQNKLNRGNETLEEWIKQYPTPQAQEDFVSKKLLEIDIENKLGKTYSRRVAKEEDVKAGRASQIGDWVYYTQKSNEVATAKVEQQGGEDANKPTADEKKQTAFNNLIIERIKTGKAIPGKGGMYLKVINGKGVLYKFNADGVRLPVDTTGDDLQDMINTIGGTVEVDNKGRRKIK